MAALTGEEKQFYTDFYRALSAPDAQFFIRYATMEYQKALDKVRKKNDQYDYGHANGLADAWINIMRIREHVTNIMRTT